MVAAAMPLPGNQAPSNGRDWHATGPVLFYSCYHLVIMVPTACPPRPVGRSTRYHLPRSLARILPSGVRGSSFSSFSSLLILRYSSCFSLARTASSSFADCRLANAAISMVSLLRLPSNLAAIAAAMLFTDLAVADLLGGGAQPFNVLSQTCNRFQHQAVLKNGSIYQDGGNNVFANYTTYSPYPQNVVNGSEVIGLNLFLIQTPLDRSWNTESNISMIAHDKSPLGYPAQGSTYGKPPQVYNAALYAGANNDSRVWLFGGSTPWWNTSWVNFTNPSDNTYTLWSVDTNTQAWTSYDIRSQVPERPNNGYFAEDPTTGRAWWINGFLESGSDTNTQDFGDYVKAFQNGIIAFNFAGESPVVHNVSSSANPWGSPRVGGLAEYVPTYGADGILVMFGGGSKPASSLNSDDHGAYIDMSEVWVWDINRRDSDNVNGSWYMQRATGDIPSARSDSCSLGWAAPDNSSYQIYVHAGRDANSFYDDLYVLSLPQFRWTRIYDTSAEVKFGHTCHKLPGNQIVRTGGVNTWSIGKGGDCDNNTRQISVFDLSNPSQGWSTNFTASNGSYTVPRQVYSAIGGSATGGRNISQTPVAGWASDELRRVFARETIAPASGLSGGAIAGIVIGVLVAVALVGALVGYCFFYRPRRARSHELHISSPKELPDSEASSRSRSAPVVRAPDYYAEKDAESVVRYEKDGGVYEKRAGPGLGLEEAQATPTEMPADDNVVFEMDGRGVGEPKKV